MGLPHLQHNYKTCSSKSAYQNNRQCFQILGIDIMLDKKLKPWLLEINESPSFNDDTEVDREVKAGLIGDTFRLLDIKKNQKQRIKEMASFKSVVQRNKMSNMHEDDIKMAQERDQHKMDEQQRKFEKFQMKNLGGFQKIYPITEEMIAKLEGEKQQEDMLKRRELYEMIKDHAADLFSKQFGVKKTPAPLNYE